MALQDTLTELTGKGPAAKNRVELLLDKLAAESPDDFKTLSIALRTPASQLPHHVITKALRKEYGTATVTDYSVGEWRRRHVAEVTGL
jgi:hypothetical protein